MKKTTIATKSKSDFTPHYNPENNVDVEDKVRRLMEETTGLPWMGAEATKNTPPCPGKERWPGIQMIDKRDLIVNTAFQRLRGGNFLKDKIVQRIINDFDWDEFDPIDVIRYDGKNFCVDEFGRLIGLVFHPDVRLVPCYVTNASSIKDVRRYYEQKHDNSRHTKITNSDDLRTRYAQNDPYARRLVEYIEKCGFRFDKDRTSTKNSRCVWDDRCTTQLCFAVNLKPTKHETYNWEKIESHIRFYCLLSSIYFNGLYIPSWWAAVTQIITSLAEMKKDDDFSVISDKLTIDSLFEGRAEFGKDGSVVGIENDYFNEKNRFGIKGDIMNTKQRSLAIFRSLGIVEMIFGRKNGVCSSLAKRKSCWNRQVNTSKREVAFGEEKESTSPKKRLVGILKKIGDYHEKTLR